jgi:hypothetical protein
MNSASGYYDCHRKPQRRHVPGDPAEPHSSRLNTAFHAYLPNMNHYFTNPQLSFKIYAPFPEKSNRFSSSSQLMPFVPAPELQVSPPRGLRREQTNW